MAALALGFFGLTQAAQAQWFVGGTFGSAKIDVDCRGTTECDSGDTGVKVYGGHKLPVRNLPNFALEAGYIDFGKAKASSAFVSRSNAVSAFVFNAAIRPEFTREFSGTVRAGLAYVNGDVDSTVGPLQSARSSDSNIHLYVGLGLAYAINKQWRVTGDLDFTGYDSGSDSGNVRLLSIGAQYGF
ncbi:MAG: hypothetical protein RI920_1137 [Pseudomonadota bacterium]